MTMTAPAEVQSPAAIAAVEDALRAFAKALRAMQLYLPNNPTRVNAIEGARASFGRVWKFAEPLEVQIRESSLLWDERVVYDDSERGAEGLPWLMYRDGLRSVTFSDGFEGESLDALLNLFLRARSLSPDEDDLVTLLWVADLVYVTYQHVESNAPQGGMPKDDAIDPNAADLAALGAPAAESAPVGDGPPPGMIRLEDFDETLFFLESKELRYLQDEVRREYSEDCRRGAIAALFEVIAMPVDKPTRLEALEVVDQLLLEFLAASDFELTAVVLREASFVRRHVGNAADIEAMLGALPARLSEPLVMGQLLQALDESERVLGGDLLETLFAELRASALQSLLGWLGTAQQSLARAGVERASLRLASAHTTELAALLDHDDIAVVQGAIRIATTLATPAAVPALARLLSNAATGASIRCEVVAALREIGTAGALRALEQAIDDQDREVRVAAFRAITVRTHAPALPRLRTAIKRKELRAADLGEKMALFEAFGTLCGDGGVAELNALLNARGLLGAREPTEVRA
ncbi:MAG: HEAT repeat domain-containing protein, partial [Gemmatimonas sp.]